MPYTLYNLYGSPPCAIVRMLAKHIGVDLELKNVDPFKKEHLTPEYLKLNPFHKIPTFSDDGFIIYESTAICYYLLRKHAPESELYPNCPRARARIDQALATITSTIQPHYFKFFKPRFYELKKPTAEDVEQFEENVIKGFEHVLGEGNYVLGDKLSLADLSLVAHLTLVLELALEAKNAYRVTSHVRCFSDRCQDDEYWLASRVHVINHVTRRSLCDIGSAGEYFSSAVVPWSHDGKTVRGRWSICAKVVCTVPAAKAASCVGPSCSIARLADELKRKHEHQRAKWQETAASETSEEGCRKTTTAVAMDAPPSPSATASETDETKVPFLDADKYPKLKAYYNRLKAELPYFEEVNREGISGLSTLSANLK